MFLTGFAVLLETVNDDLRSILRLHKILRIMEIAHPWLTARFQGARSGPATGNDVLHGLSLEPARPPDLPPALQNASNPMAHFVKWCKARFLLGYKQFSDSVWVANFLNHTRCYTGKTNVTHVTCAHVTSLGNIT
ncbi:Spectrin beta chain, non-erythrocytic 5 [Frankliniella fusca]|uniref:Spectrin beta chain, non-erythrocytic 5 n=1 Tax=Frankliniella fusca TaxID=407009 RepID=A0AAE1H3E4_9NEOP|nr:Spectrin beta chain, non-erythrocytic 5 [Frankliniella fusca]